MSYVQMPQPCQIPKLTITVEIPNSGEPFAIGSQGVVQSTEQPGNRRRSQYHPASAQCLLNLAERAVRPFQARDRIPSRRILEQFLQDLQNVRAFFSARGRPAPWRRTLRDTRGPPRRSSRRPRATVL